MGISQMGLFYEWQRFISWQPRNVHKIQNAWKIPSKYATMRLCYSFENSCPASVKTHLPRTSWVHLTTWGWACSTLKSKPAKVSATTFTQHPPPPKPCLPIQLWIAWKLWYCCLRQNSNWSTPPSQNSTKTHPRSPKWGVHEQWFPLSTSYIPAIENKLQTLDTTRDLQ